MSDPDPIGHNQPPEPTPFEAIRDKIEGLYLEAKNWMDGTPIASQAQADEVKKLQDLIAGAEKEADKLRVEMNKPFDEGKAKVQADFAPLIADTKAVTGKTVLAVEACRKALTPWKTKLDEERKEAAAKAAKEAQEKAAAAQAAIAAANASTDLTAQEKAKALIDEAAKAQKTANRAAAPVARGLRANWVPSITDQKAAIFHYMKDQPQRFLDLALQCAREDVRAGKRQIPGFEVVNQPTAT